MGQTRRNKRTGGQDWPKRGEIYLTALDPTVGREIKKTRPALIIQNDTSNRYSAMTLVAPITSTVRFPLSPVHVLIPADEFTGLAVESVAVFDQIRAIDRRRLRKKLGEVNLWLMYQVEEALRDVFDLPEFELNRKSVSLTDITTAISDGNDDFTVGKAG